MRIQATTALAVVVLSVVKSKLWSVAPLKSVSSQSVSAEVAVNVDRSRMRAVELTALMPEAALGCAWVIRNSTRAVPTLLKVIVLPPPPTVPSPVKAPRNAAATSEVRSWMRAV